MQTTQHLVGNGGSATVPSVLLV